MRSLIIGFVVFLAACNGSNNADPAVATLQAQVNDLTKALAAATHEEAQKFAGLKLIGKSHGTAERELAIGTSAVNFGPCADMGVLEGETVNSGNGALGAVYQAFKNCAGVHAEYSVDTGELKTANRVYFTSPDCSGMPLVWQAGGQGYNSQILNDGVAFISPVDGQAYWVQGGQIPQMTQAGSVYIVINGSCVPDGDLQPMWTTVPNDTAQTGVPLSVGKYQITAP